MSAWDFSGTKQAIMQGGSRLADHYARRAQQQRDLRLYQERRDEQRAYDDKIYKERKDAEHQAALERSRLNAITQSQVAMAQATHKQNLASQKEEADMAKKFNEDIKTYMGADVDWNTLPEAGRSTAKWMLNDVKTMHEDVEALTERAISDGLLTDSTNIYEYRKGEMQKRMQQSLAGLAQKAQQNGMSPENLKTLMESAKKMYNVDAMVYDDLAAESAIAEKGITASVSQYYAAEHLQEKAGVKLHDFEDFEEKVQAPLVGARLKNRVVDGVDQVKHKILLQNSAQIAGEVNKWTEVNAAQTKLDKTNKDAFKAHEQVRVSEMNLESLKGIQADLNNNVITTGPFMDTMNRFWSLMGKTTIEQEESFGAIAATIREAFKLSGATVTANEYKKFKDFATMDLGSSKNKNLAVVRFLINEEEKRRAEAKSSINFYKHASKAIDANDIYRQGKMMYEQQLKRVAIQEIGMSEEEFSKVYTPLNVSVVQPKPPGTDGNMYKKGSTDLTQDRIQAAIERKKKAQNK